MKILLLVLCFFLSSCKPCSTDSTEECQKGQFSIGGYDIIHTGVIVKVEYMMNNRQYRNDTILYFGDNTSIILRGYKGLIKCNIPVELRSVIIGFAGGRTIRLYYGD